MGKDRIPHEIDNRAGIEKVLADWLSNVPTEGNQIDIAVEKVRTLVLRTYSFIRSQVCDQVEIFAESFFKLPMLRRLEEDMSCISLEEEQCQSTMARRRRLHDSLEEGKLTLQEVTECIERLQRFSLEAAALGSAGVVMISWASPCSSLRGVPLRVSAPQ